ncbi:MAG: MBL fold metallo-hydrolase [Pseudomonadales bacterium]|nr:MBL fold metallo-hydrolase [Pseudomonadales bacterium]
MKRYNNIPTLAKQGCLGLALMLSACSEPAPETDVTTAALVQQMLANMGGLDAIGKVDSLVQRGAGTREHLGQIPVTEGSDPTATLNNLVETIDLRNARAAFDNDVVIGAGFSQHRTEVLTRLRGQPVAWGTTAGRPRQATSVNGLFSWATQNSPEFLLRRNIIAVVRAAARVAPEQRAQERVINGLPYWYGQTRTDDGEAIGLFFDQDSGLLAGYLTLDTEPMLGDKEALYLLDDYRQVDGLLLPFWLEIMKGDEPWATIQYDSISLNDAEALRIFELPGDVLEQAGQVLASDGSWVPLQWHPVTATVSQVEAFSHHSMVVEFPDFVVVVEGPYTEGQSLTLVRQVEERIGKPVRYVVPTHPHYDHTGGIRGLASAGATVLVAAGHEAELRQLVESPHSNPPDALARQIRAGAEVGRVEVFSGMTEVADGGQALFLYELSGIPHVEPMVLAYVPGAGVLFQSDLFFGAPGADASALYDAIASLGLQVTTLVGGHGGVLSYSALETAVNGN